MHDSFVESLKRQLTFNSPFLLHPGNNSKLTRTSSHWHFIARVLLPASFLHNGHFHFCAVTHGRTNKDHNVACDCKLKTNVRWGGGVSSHQCTRLMVKQMWGMSFRRLHQFGRSSRRWSDPRCPLCRTAAAPFSGPSERSDQSGAKTGKREGTPLKGWFRLSCVRWDELTAFYLYLRIPYNRARTACTCVRKFIYWLLLQRLTWQHFSWTWQFRFVFHWTAPTFGHTGATCHHSISKLVKSTSRSFGFRLAAQFQQRKAK